MGRSTCCRCRGERTRGLVLTNTVASPPPAEFAEQFMKRIEREWGTGILERIWGETGDTALRSFSRMERVAATPRAAANLIRHVLKGVPGEWSLLAVCP